MMMILLSIGIWYAKNDIIIIMIIIIFSFFLFCINIRFFIGVLEFGILLLLGDYSLNYFLGMKL